MDPRPNYDECVQIETARCRVRGECQGIDEFDNAYGGFDVDTCISYSKEHCRTRRLNGVNWTQKDVDACVDAILSLKNDCTRLLPKGIDETEKIGQCNFIDNGDAGLIDLSTESDDSDTGPASSGDENGTDTGSSNPDAGA
jgi:hypothetical protein